MGELLLTPPNDRDLVIHYAQFDHAQYKDELFSICSIDYPTVLKGAYSRRKAEFLAGRYSAQQSLLRLFKKNTIYIEKDVDISIGRNRQPLFPVYSRGSITHSGAVSLSAVGLSEDFHALGIDFEFIVSDEDALILQKQVLYPTELQLAKTSHLDTNTMITLIFSAKESLFKALYPDVGAYFDFFAAEVINIEYSSTETQQPEDRWLPFSIRLSRSLSVTLRSGVIFSGYYCLLKGGALSLITLSAKK